MKTCPKCGETKPLNSAHFHKGSKAGFQAYCKPCRKTYSATRHRAAPEVNRKASMRLRFGLLAHEYEDMLCTQDSNCAICKKRFTKSPHVDHNHATGKVRGLLCGQCNRMLGLAYDSQETLVNALVYLENHSA